MKIKKIIGGSSLLLVVLALASCGNDKADVSYVDPVTNETKTVTIEKTSDSAKVADALTALYYKEAETDAINSLGMKLSMIMDMECIKGEDVYISDASLDYDIRMKFPEIYFGENGPDLTYNTELYAKMSMDSVITNVVLNGDTGLKELVNEENKMDLELFSDTDNFYINMFDDSIEDEELRNQKMYFEKVDIPSNYLEQIESSLESIYQSFKSDDTVEKPSIEDAIEDSNYGETLVEVIEKLGLEITKVNGDNVSFKAVISNSSVPVITIQTTTDEVKDEDSTDIILEFGLNVKSLLPNFISIDLTDYFEDMMTLQKYDEVNVDKVKMKVSIDYNTSIPKVTNIDEYTLVPEELLADMLDNLDEFSSMLPM